jgi:exodeoxyribonuclease V alpha subunit
LNPRLLAPDEQLTGEVLGCADVAGDNGTVLVELSPGDDPDRGPGVWCAGPLTDLVEGQLVTLAGRWHDHPKLGRLFEAVYYERRRSEPLDGLRAFLATDGFADISPRVRGRALTTFGAAVGRVIEHDPDQLRIRGGLTAEEARSLHAAWMATPTLAAWVSFIGPATWPIDAVLAAHARFGRETVAVANDDPYAMLAADGVRFAHAERLAHHLGVERADPHRLRAAAIATVAAARRRCGHEHLVLGSAVASAARLVGVDLLLGAEGVAAAVAAGDLAVDVLDDREIVSTPAALRDESDLAEQLARLLACEPRRRSEAVPVDDFSEDVGASATVRLAARRAVLGGPVSVVTGDVGALRVGMVGHLVHAAEVAGLLVAVCAPTSRAAAHLETSLGRPVPTIGELLESRPPAVTWLPHDLIVVAEASGCATSSAARLAAAVADGARLAWVGDPLLQPPEGSGQVLRDLLGCEDVEVVAIAETGQAAVESRLVGLAREVRAGEVGVLRGADGDVFLAEEPASSAVVARAVQAVTERIPTYFGVEAEHIQVLAPVRWGATGVDALRTGLQAAGSPARPMTVDQAQDGTWPVVVLVLDREHGAVWSRERLYTAVTRAQRALVIVGQAEIVRAAARVSRSERRRTGLTERLGSAREARGRVGAGRTP